MKSQRNKAGMILAFALFAQAATAIANEGQLPEGGHAGNGGDTAEMRRQLLNRDQVFELLKNNGEKLKKEVLLPLVTNFIPSAVTDMAVRPSYATMIQGYLADDILYSSYDITSPDCQNLAGASRAAQTEPVMRARICFDVEYIARDGNTVGSIAGLALHEHAHHYGIDDHPYYRIANYFKGVVEDGEYLVQMRQETLEGQSVVTFGHNGTPLLADGMMVLAIEPRASNWTYAYRSPSEYERDYASQFCRWKGYADVASRTVPVPTGGTRTDLAATTYRYSHRDPNARYCSFENNAPRARGFDYVAANERVMFFETISCLAAAPPPQRRVYGTAGSALTHEGKVLTGDADGFCSWNGYTRAVSHTTYDYRLDHPNTYYRFSPGSYANRVLDVVAPWGNPLHAVLGRGVVAPHILLDALETVTCERVSF